MNKTKPWSKIISKTANFKLKKGVTSFINPFSMLLLINEHLIAEEVDQWCIDGISLVNKLNKTLKLKYTRYSFDETSLAPKIFQYAKENNLRIALIGTKEEYIAKAVNNIEQKHNVKIYFTRNGYFNSDYEKEKCYQKILDLKVDLVICGMGTPYQERFLIELKNKGWNGYGLTCGGYLHQMAKSQNYYPVFFDKLNIRWIYRIIDEPKLFKRYFIDYPKFFFRFYFFRRSL
ncbi:glycosyl transferase [Solitalea longa]|uniref:Glycosyl transferase n=1 Tax=Solitalea longa TaxID=2079460 RepID=A0A2S4ZX22_9SPHI|nr:WecB/TagA/CpsF family glycosyltransferase [Solitalea longa]POY34911.1 glycosyl transferase [Solitalea longa]